MQKYVKILILVAITFSLTACGFNVDNRSTKEILQTAIKKNEEILSQEGNLDINMSLSKKLAVRISKYLNLNLSNSAKFTNLNMKSKFIKDKETKKFKIENILNYKVGEKKFNIEVYTNSENEFVIKHPFSNKYGVLPKNNLLYSRLAKSIKFQSSLERKNLMLDFYFKLLKDEKFKTLKKEIEINSKKEKITLISLEYSGEEFYSFVDRVIENFLSNDIYPLYAKSLEMKEIEGKQPISKEKFDNYTKVLKTYYKKNRERLLAHFKNIVDAKKVSLNIGINKKGYIVYTDITVDIDIKNEKSESSKFFVRFETKNYNINKLKNDDIKFPVLNSKNKIDFSKVLDAILESVE